MKAKVALNLRGLNYRDQLAKAQKAITKCTGNTDITTPNPSLASLQTKVDLGKTKLDAVDAKAAELDGLRLEATAAVSDAMDGYAQLGTYVENRAAGDAIKIANAGYDVAATPAPIGPLGQALDLVLTEGDHVGTLDWMCKPVKGASALEIWVSADPMSDTSWKFGDTATKSSGTLKNLASGSKVWVRLRAKGAAPEPGPWSDPATKTVP